MGEKSRILITGGCGFIGSHLAERLSCDGYRVRVFDSRPWAHALKPEALEGITGDLSRLSDVAAAVSDCDGVVHLAATSRSGFCSQKPLECIVTNVMGTANVLEAIRTAEERPWLILGSSREAASEARLYGATKRFGEVLAERYSHDYKIGGLVLRFSDVYGSERDNPSKVLPRFLRAALLGEPITILDESERFDFIHYDDLVKGIVLGVKRLERSAGHACDAAILCTGKAISLRDLAEIIVCELGSSSSISVKGSAGGRNETTMENDVTRAYELLGFRSGIELREGLKSLARTMRVHGG